MVLLSVLNTWIKPNKTSVIDVGLAPFFRKKFEERDNRQRKENNQLQILISIAGPNNAHLNLEWACLAGLAGISFFETGIYR